MNDCIHCNNKTKNPKFCSRSCAATHNNKTYPKRRLEGHCKLCVAAISSGRTYCTNCWKQTAHSGRDWASVTLADLRAEGNANFGGNYPMIRQLSRKWYLASNKPKRCFVCGYHLHIDVAHIKDVKSFDASTPISVVNSLNNLVALCKNHHWEFDNGHLDHLFFH